MLSQLLAKPFVSRGLFAGALVFACFGGLESTKSVLVDGDASTVMAQPLSMAGPAIWRERDKHVESAFAGISVGMMREQVLDAMPCRPGGETDRSMTWRLSHWSNSATKRDWTLTAYFEDDTVTSKDTAFTCVYTVETAPGGP